MRDGVFNRSKNWRGKHRLLFRFLNPDLHRCLVGRHGGPARAGLASTLFCTETVMHSFGDSEGDGFLPEFELVRAKGKLYGITSGGGVNYFGTVFAVDLATGSEKAVYAFNNDFGSPMGGLTNVKYLYGYQPCGIRAQPEDRGCKGTPHL